MNHYVEVSVKEAEDKIISNPQALILDVRDAYSYKDGHIDGAMQAHGGLVEHLIASKQHHRPVLIYCYHGTSSKDLAELFGRSGYSECYSMRGGYTAWKKRDFLYAETPYSAATNEWLKKECFEDQALNATIDSHVTPLMLACQQDKPSILQELINAGADLEARNTDGNTAVWFATYSESIECLDLLIKAGANVNQQNSDGVSALMYAASAGKTEMVKYLVEQGAAPLIENRDGFSALDLAANVDILKYLKPFLTRSALKPSD